MQNEERQILSIMASLSARAEDASTKNQAWQRVWDSLAEAIITDAKTLGLPVINGTPLVTIYHSVIERLRTPVTPTEDKVDGPTPGQQ